MRQQYAPTFHAGNHCSASPHNAVVCIGRTIAYTDPTKTRKQQLRTQHADRKAKSTENSLCIKLLKARANPATTERKAQLTNNTTKTTTYNVWLRVPVGQRVCDDFAPADLHKNTRSLSLSFKSINSTGPSHGLSHDYG